MSCSKMEDVSRYWNSRYSRRVLEPVFKYLGLRKRLDLMQINKEIVQSWLKRNQTKLILVAVELRGNYPLTLQGEEG